MDRIVCRSGRRWFHFAFCLAAGAACLNAQLISSTTAIPRTAEPPVLFLNGYQSGCIEAPTFESAFGLADQILQRDGRVSLFFDNCAQAKNRPLEEVGAALGQYLESLRYVDGQPVAQVDVVAHSMGGLIVRSYLSGKQPARGEFRPPAQIRIRKAVFLAVPFFGAIATEFPGAPTTDVQIDQQRPGSAFLYDLATWNQGIDDLREIDSMAIVADGGSGIVSGNGRNADDSTVSVTSASLEFAMPGRTRILNYCHTRLTGLLVLGCSIQTSVAYLSDESHDTARILRSFLSGTSDWQTIGVSPSAHPRLSRFAGLLGEARSAEDGPVVVQSATVSQGSVRVRGERIWSEDIPTGTPVRLSVTRSTGTMQTEVTFDPATERVLRLVDGSPNIAAVLPSPSTGKPRVTAPGMFVTIYGSNLASATAQAPSQPYPASLGGVEVRINGQAAPVQYVSPGQINFLMPDSASGVVRLQLRNSLGTQSVNVLVEPYLPSLFGVAAPAVRGEYVVLYLTGLGRTERRPDGLDWALITPVVTIGGKPCPVYYAGRSPGFSGLDQINCLVAVDAATGSSVTATVTTGSRTGSAAIAVR